MGFSDARFDVNLSILFTELPLLERPAAAAAAGFTATPCARRCVRRARSWSA